MINAFMGYFPSVINRKQIATISEISTYNVEITAATTPTTPTTSGFYLIPESDLFVCKILIFLLFFCIC